MSSPVLKAKRSVVAERKIEAALVQAVEKGGGLCLKLSVPGVRGLPDRIVFMPARPAFLVETKTKRGVLSQHQIVWHARLQQRDVAVYVLRRIEDIGRLLP
jgi:hypothetical protein